jgi:hypothetical protein
MASMLLDALAVEVRQNRPTATSLACDFCLLCSLLEDACKLFRLVYLFCCKRAMSETICHDA